MSTEGSAEPSDVEAVFGDGAAVWGGVGFRADRAVRGPWHRPRAGRSLCAVARFPHRAVAALCLLVGCAETPFDLAEGEACERSVQCGRGLACVMGFCNPDPTGIGGEVPGGTGGGAGDAGAVPDGGPLPPPPDAGTPGADGG